MFCKLKTSLVVTLLMTLFVCALASPVAIGQGTATDPATKTDAEKAVELRKDIDERPLWIIGVEPYVANNKGILGSETPAIPGTPSIAGKPGTPGTPAKAGKLAIAPTAPIPETPAIPPKRAVPGTAGTPGEAGMGDRIAVVIDSRFIQAVKYKVIDPTQLVLFVDGRVFKGVHPESVNWNRVVFKLERTTLGQIPEAMDAWNSLLGSPGLNNLKPVKVSVGFAEQQPYKLGFDQPNLMLIVYRGWWALVSLVVLVLLFGLFWKYGRTSLLRDSGPPNPPKGTQRPYSLAKVQVAWWFFLVVGCFLVIYLITGEFTMTEQALTLIGIGTGTALGSAMIDSSKRNSADSELSTLNPQKARLETEIAELKNEKVTLDTAVSTNPGATDVQKAALKTDQETLKAKNIELAGKQEELKAVNASIEDAKTGLEKPTSEGWWSDMVTDASGPSFHRFQMIAWTVVLGVLFVASVYKSLSMPVFNGTMLALMGISAGTYLGFKIPEKQTSAADTAATAGANAAVSNPVVTAGAVADEAETIDGCDVDIVDETPDEDLPVTEGGVQ